MLLLFSTSFKFERVPNYISSRSLFLSAFQGSGEREDNIAVKTRNQRTRSCCCVHVSKSCPNPQFNKPNNGGNNGGLFPNNGGNNGGFLSAASPRFGPEGEIADGDIGSRILNRVS